MVNGIFDTIKNKGYKEVLGNDILNDCITIFL